MKTSSKLIYVQALSSLSLWLDIFLIFTVPVYIWHASPSSIAFLAFCLGAPMLFLGPIIGTLIDRHDVRKTLLLGALLRTLSTVALAVSPDLQSFFVFRFIQRRIKLILLSFDDHRGSKTDTCRRA